MPVRARAGKPGPLLGDIDAGLARWLVQPGHCCRCDTWVHEAIVVAMEQGNSGPGHLVRACLPHARELARYGLAPDWLREDLTAHDTAQAQQLGRTP